jgi:hypothetical protein
MRIGPAKAATLAEILRELSRARLEARLRPRPAAPPFHQHLARTPSDDPVAFSTFLRQQNREDRAAARRLDWCGPHPPRLDLYG